MALKLALDAGHGLSKNKGIPKALDKNQTREWTLNDRIADKLEVALKDYDVSIIRTDDTTGKEDVSLAERCRRANEFGADFFISIHHNGGALLTNAGGTKVFYYSSKAERKEQAQSLYDCVVAETKLVGNRSTKVSKKSLYVLRNTDMGAVMLENGFMDSKLDYKVILTEEHADKTVVGIVNFLIKEFGMVKKKVEPTEKYQSKKVVDVQLHQIKKGDVGNHVRLLNAILYSLGYKVGTSNVFDEDTEKAVKLEQKAHKLKEDGIVGKDTWSIWV
jgi:N-acetylmuramoyl-L-alanine amidase